MYYFDANHNFAIISWETGTISSAFLESSLCVVCTNVFVPTLNTIAVQETKY